MEIAGVEVPPGTAAQLAMLLSRAGYAELAMRVGLAVDANLARRLPEQPQGTGCVSLQIALNEAAFRSVNEQIYGPGGSGEGLHNSRSHASVGPVPA